MKRFDVKHVLRHVRHHLRILARGLLRTLWGAAAAGLAAVAAGIFAAIPAEAGYMAVFDFIGAAATTVVALCGIYAFGRNSRRKDAR